MLTRRTLLHALPLLLLPRLAPAQPRLLPLQASSHPLNHPASCQGWWLAHPLTLRGPRWHDLLRRQAGTLTSMGLLLSSASGPRALTTRRGGFGEVRFDATGGHVVIPGVFGAPAAITVAAWLTWTQVDVDTDAADAWSLGGNVILRLLTFQTECKYFHTSGDWHTLIWGTTLLGTGWHHVAYTCDPAQARQVLYVDGQVVATATQTTPMSYAGGSTTLLGKNPDNNAFDFGGGLDDVRVYSRALTGAEVRLLHADALAGYPQLLAPQTEGLPAPPAVAATPSSPRRSRVW